LSPSLAHNDIQGYGINLISCHSAPWVDLTIQVTVTLEEQEVTVTWLVLIKHS
jgi:hypothetical protein